MEITMQHPIQLCTSNFVGRTTHGCDHKVFKNFWPYSVYFNFDLNLNTFYCVCSLDESYFNPSSALLASNERV